MSSQTITDLPFSPSKSDPSLFDLLNLHKKEVNLDLNCHHVGTIQSFNPANQTASATINYQKTNYERSTSGVYEPVLTNYPLAIDCPIICLGGGPGSLTFPISKGDECLVLFNDRELSNWFQGAGGGSVATARLHSFADGIIIVGIRSLANVLTNYPSDRVAIKYGTTTIAATATQVQIANAADGNLGASMTVFLNALKAFMIACESSSDTTLASAASTFITAASNAIIKIEGILE